MDKYKIDDRIYLLLSVLVFLVPLRWLTAWLLAVTFHEICHVIALKLYGGTVYSFSIGLGGANMECADLTENKYLISVLAGPIGGFLLAILGRWFPRLAICSWILSVYNSLPILPLDGGQVIRILIKNDSICNTLEKICIIIVFLLAVYACFFTNFGPVLLLISISLWQKNRKRPCKGPFRGVQ